MSDTAQPRRRRAGGRAANTAKRQSVQINQMPWRLPINTDRPTEPLYEDGVQAIHDGAMKILEDIGIEFLNEEALALFKQAGISCLATCRLRRIILTLRSAKRSAGTANNAPICCA